MWAPCLANWCRIERLCLVLQWSEFVDEEKPFASWSIFGCNADLFFRKKQRAMFLANTNKPLTQTRVEDTQYRFLGCESSTEPYNRPIDHVLHINCIFVRHIKAICFLAYFCLQIWSENVTYLTIMYTEDVNRTNIYWILWSLLAPDRGLID